MEVVGARETLLEGGSAGSLLGRLYGSDSLTERHCHSHIINPESEPALAATGLRVVGKSGENISAIERDDHPFFVCTQVSKNDEFCIKNEKLCFKNDQFCIKNDEFCSSTRSSTRDRDVRPLRLSVRFSRAFFSSVFFCFGGLDVPFLSHGFGLIGSVVIYTKIDEFLLKNDAFMLKKR